ncbi:MAG: acyltransferase family protein [Hyphomicrobiaceae bacterium]
MPVVNETDRLDWVDAAKGLCIIMVVMMHATLGVEKSLGTANWLHNVVDWAEPFRMPDFFLISGLFLAARIGRPWRSYFDGKILHFVYFYLVWTHIHFLLRAPVLIKTAGLEAAAWQYARSYVDPAGPIWFIYLLAVYFLVTKLLHAVPKALVLGAAVALHVLAPRTGLFVVDEFASRFVFFFAGYAYAPMVFDFARRVCSATIGVVAATLGAWAIVNTLAVSSGASHLPGLDLVFSALGIAAVVGCSVLVSMPARQGAWRGYLGAALLYCGRNSIVIYLSFTIFMALSRVAMLKLWPGAGGVTISLISAAAGLGGALGLHAFVSNTKLAFLFERPAWARLPARSAPRQSSALMPKAA